MVAAMCAGAWLNKWNDTMGTRLEDIPAERAARVMGPKGWTIGKHGVETKEKATAS